MVQTSLTDLEHKLLEEFAKTHSKTVKETVREAILRHIIKDEVSATETVFTTPPVAKRTGIKERTSELHDEVLYGLNR